MTGAHDGPPIATSFDRPVATSRAVIAREPPTLSVSTEGMSDPGNGVDAVTRGIFVAMRRVISGSSLLMATKIAALKDPPGNQ